MIIWRNLHYDWISLVQEYKQPVTPAAVVLEIGASSKSRTRMLARHCKRLIGIELMPERLPHNFANVTYRVGNWEQLTKTLKAESIDLAISSHVIEHVPNDVQALHELYAVLKPGGVAILNTPNRARLPRRIVELFAGKRQFPWAEHVREYTADDLRRLIKKTPFKQGMITPVTIGVHGGRQYLYSTYVPSFWKNLANFWQVTLVKTYLSK